MSQRAGGRHQFVSFFPAAPPLRSSPSGATARSRRLGAHISPAESPDARTKRSRPFAGARRHARGLRRTDVDVDAPTVDRSASTRRRPRRPGGALRRAALRQRWNRRWRSDRDFRPGGNGPHRVERRALQRKQWRSVHDDAALRRDRRCLRRSRGHGPQLSVQRHPERKPRRDGAGRRTRTGGRVPLVRGCDDRRRRTSRRPDVHRHRGERSGDRAARAIARPCG